MRFRSFVANALALAGMLGAGSAAAAQVFPTGALLTDKTYYNAIPVSAPTVSEHRNAVDLSRYMPPVGNQENLGSCVGWAVAYAARSFAAGIKGAPNWPLAVPGGQFSPGFLYNEIKARTGTGLCDRQGISVSAALQFTQGTGAVLLTGFPYNAENCNLRPSPSLIGQAGAWKIRDFASLGDFGAVPLTKIIESLDAGRPVILTIGVDHEFMSYRGGVLATYTGPTHGYHAIVAVGYDRDAGTLKLQNSWDTDWGESGTVRISFAAAQRMIYEAYVILDASTLDLVTPVPSPTPAPTPIGNLTQRYFDWFDAIHRGRTDAVKAGLDAGLRPDVEVAKDTGLGWAIEAGNVGLVRLLLRHNPKLNVYVRGVGNYLVLASLSERNSEELVKVLLDAGINPNILDNQGYSTLCTINPSSEEANLRQIFKLVKAAGGRCIAPEVQFK